MSARLQFNRRLWLGAAIAVCFFAAVYVGLSSMGEGPVPAMLAARGISLLEQYLPLEIAVESVRFQGPLRLALTNVDVTTAQIDGITRMHIDEVYLDFDLLSVLRNDHLAGIKQIQLIAPEIVMEYDAYMEYVRPAEAQSRRAGGGAKRLAAKPAPPKVSSSWPALTVHIRRGRVLLDGAGAPGALQVNATVHSSDQAIQVKRLQVMRGAGQLLAYGELQASGDISAQIKAADWLLADALAWYPYFTVAGRGTLDGQVQVEGTLQAPATTARLELHAAKLAWPNTTPTQYLELTKATASLMSIPGGWQVDALEVNTPTGKLTASGRTMGQSLQLALAAQDLALPADIPLVAIWGIAGQAAFNGEVTGTFAQPVLSGRLTMDTGQVWHQDVDSAAGFLTLTRERMQFDQIEITKGRARYQLQGELDQPAAADPTIDGRLISTAGRVEDLLAVLGLSLDATGEMDGTLTFQGPFSQVVTTGDVTVQDAYLFGEALDWAQGRFRWGDGQLALQDVKARAATGELLVTGTAALDGSALDMHVTVSDWALERIEHLKQLATDWRGDFSFQGDLQGSATNPQVRGQMSAHRLQLGKAMFEELSGPVTFADGHLVSSGLHARTKQGGDWRLSGELRHLWQNPQLDVRLALENESLSALLAMGGYRVPAALVDGAVHGSVDLAGAIGDPQAHLKLFLTDPGMPARHGLQLELRIADRRVSIIRLGA